MDYVQSGHRINFLWRLEENIHGELISQISTIQIHFILLTFLNILMRYGSTLLQVTDNGSGV